MKLPKTILAGLLALSTATLANAVEIIHITGSTAFRTSAMNAILGVMQPATLTYAWVGNPGSTLQKSTYSIISGTTSGGIQVIVKCYWSGSTGGLALVNGNATPSPNEWLTNTTPMSASGTIVASSSAAYDPPATPEVTMTDGSQVSTVFSSPALTAVPVGIVAFKWCRNAGSPATLANMTPGLARSLLSTGSLPLALWTGVQTDSNTLVYALGRDGDSGTRVNTFAETGFGPFNEPLQYAPTNAAGSIVSGSVPGPIAGQEPWPAETISYTGVTYQTGQGGYSSGGDLAAAMTNSFVNGSATIKGYYLAYLGVPDASTVTNNGGAELTWNGFAYGTNTVAQGQYSFWGVEHMEYLPTYSTTDANGFATANLIAAYITTNTATQSGVLLSQMAVQRAADGGPITPIYSTLPTY